MQARVVTGLSTGCNTLRTCFYIMGVMDSPLHRWHGAEEETSSHILYEWICGDTRLYLGSFFWTLRMLEVFLSLMAIWNIIKVTGLQWLGHQSKRHIKRIRWSRGRVLPLSTQVRGFKPRWSRQDYSGWKNPQHAFLRRGSKAIGPMSQICGM
jgi:hypothetical protein